MTCNLNIFDIVQQFVLKSYVISLFVLCSVFIALPLPSSADSNSTCRPVGFSASELAGIKGHTALMIRLRHGCIFLSACMETAESVMSTRVGELIETTGASLDYVESLLRTSWIKHVYVEHLDSRFMWQLMGVALLILSGTLFWMMMLKRQISQRIRLEEELREKNRQIVASIEYASLIQHALIPREEDFQSFFHSYFTIFEPRDTVGGDLYMLELLRTRGECLVTMIDCTGHGVAGAFVTMLVKAIERQITARIVSTDERVSPANLLGVMNRSLKHLLRQEDASAISDVGFDASVLYINYEKREAIFAGAQLPLFYVQDGSLKMIKGNRQSIGYTKSVGDYVFDDHVIPLEPGKIFYLATDGYWDQNGGPKGFPMGRRRFKRLLQDIYSLPFPQQKDILLERLHAWQGDHERNDDVTVIGLEIKHKCCPAGQENKSARQDGSI